MKTKVAFLIIIFFVVISNTFAQKIKDEAVPQDVFISFKYKYPDAEVLEWAKSDTNYVADYSLKNQEGYAEFTPKGKWLKTKFYVKEKELPSPIVTYFRDNYKSLEFQIDESELVKTNENQTYYHILLKKPGIGQPEPVELFFDFSGKFQKKIDPNDSKINKDLNTNNETPDVKNQIGTDFKILEHDESALLKQMKVQFLNGNSNNELLKILMNQFEIVSFKELIPSMNDVFIHVVEQNNREIKQ